MSLILFYKSIEIYKKKTHKLVSYAKLLYPVITFQFSLLQCQEGNTKKKRRVTDIDE